MWNLRNESWRGLFMASKWQRCRQVLTLASSVKATEHTCTQISQPVQDCSLSHLAFSPGHESQHCFPILLFHFLLDYNFSHIFWALVFQSQICCWCSSLPSSFHCSPFLIQASDLTLWLIDYYHLPPNSKSIPPGTRGVIEKREESIRTLFPRNLHVQIKMKSKFLYCWQDFT